MHKQGHWEERDGKRIEDDGRGRRDRRTGIYNIRMKKIKQKDQWERDIPTGVKRNTRWSDGQNEI